MALNNVLNFLKGKKNDNNTQNEIMKKNEAIGQLLSSDNFPIIRPTDVDMSKYRKIPWSGISALGAAFSMLPESARTIKQTVATSLPNGGKLYMGFNHKGISGVIRNYGLGTSGNIVNPETGKIVGRMRFQEVPGLSSTTSTVLPIDPMTMVIAAALMNLDKKLDAIQAKVDEVLQFLKLEKQSEQRGSLNLLVEILDDFKQNCSNETMCATLNGKVLDIKGLAHKNILFYQEQIAVRLQNQRLIHGTKQAQDFLDAVMNEFREYQLACYIYGFSTFLGVLLQKSFEESFLNSTAHKMEECSSRYHELYEQCREQIAAYQQNAVETKLLGALGSAAKAMGKGIAAVPGLNKGPVDELLTKAGEALDERNKTAATQYLDKFVPMSDNRLHAFIENVHTLDLMYNRPNAMLMDDENLYILEAA